MRKIVQIAFDSNQQASYSLHALCNDGSVWALRPEWKWSPMWERLPPIPSDGVPTIGDLADGAR